jgi:hypothetical protein
MKALLVSLVFLAQLGFAEKGGQVTTTVISNTLTKTEVATVITSLVNGKGVLSAEAAKLAAQLPNSAALLNGAKSLFGSIQSEEQAIAISAKLTQVYNKYDGDLAKALEAIANKSPEQVAALNVENWNPTQGVDALFNANTAASKTANGPLAQYTTVEAAQRMFELVLNLVDTAEAQALANATEQGVAKKYLAQAKVKLTGWLSKIKEGKMGPVEKAEMDSLAYILVQAYSKAQSLKLSGDSKQLYSALSPLTVLLAQERGFTSTIKSKQFVQALVAGLLLSKETPDATQLALIQGAFRSLTGEVIPADVQLCFRGQRDLPTDKSLECHATGSCSSKM